MEVRRSTQAGGSIAVLVLLDPEGEDLEIARPGPPEVRTP
jgi:hypothetical protein